MFDLFLEVPTKQPQQLPHIEAPGVAEHGQPLQSVNLQKHALIARILGFFGCVQQGIDSSMLWDELRGALILVWWCGMN